MAATPIVTDNWAYALEPGLIDVWEEEFGRYAAELALIPRLYGLETSMTRVNSAFGMGALGYVEEVAEGNPVPRDTREQLYLKTYQQQYKQKAIDITAQMQKFQEYGEIARRARDMATAFARTRIRDAMSDFNNAFSASYLGPDGKALCATDHPASPLNADTRSNKGTTALSYDSVVATLKAMMKQTDSRDIVMEVVPDTILVPIDLVDTAWTILESLGKPGTADNDANFIGSVNLQVGVSKFLTDTNNWFMLDSRLAQSQHLWLESLAPTFGLSERESRHGVDAFVGEMWYTWGWHDWRFVYGHEVA